MTHVPLETRPTPRIPGSRGPSTAPSSPYPTATPGKASWWLGAVVGISAVAVIVIDQNHTQTTAAFQQGAAQTNANRTAEQAAVQANSAADSANASAISAENQSALIAQRNEDNPSSQPRTPRVSNTVAAPGVTTAPQQ